MPGRSAAAIWASFLRTLSAFLREDARTRVRNLETRQSWTVNAARLAVAAPWIVLAMLALRGGSLQAYAPAGWVVLAFGAHRVRWPIASWCGSGDSRKRSACCGERTG